MDKVGEWEAPFRRPLIDPHRSALPNSLYLLSFAEPLPTPWRSPWKFVTHPYVCYAVGVVCALASGAPIAAIDIIYGYWTQNATHNVDNLEPAMPYNNRLAWITVTVGTHAFVTSFLFLVLLPYAAHKLTEGLRREYFASALIQDPTFYDSHGPGAIATHANRDVEQIRAALGEKLGFLLNASGTILTCLIAGLVRAPYYSALLLALMGFMYLALTVLGYVSDKVTTRVLNVDSRLSTYIEQVIASARIVQSFELANTLVERLRALYVIPLERAVRLRSIIRGMDLAVMYFSVTAHYSLGFWWGSVCIAEGHSSMDGVVAGFYNFLNIVFSATMVVSHLQSLQESLTTIKTMRKTIERKPRIDVRSIEGRVLGVAMAKTENSTAPTYQPSLSLKNVTFAYPTRPHVASLKDVSIEFPMGQVTALVGPSGSGKSTISALLGREYDPDSVADLSDKHYERGDDEEKKPIVQGSGQVLFGGVDVRELNVRWLRSQIAVVRQSPQLLTGTIAENVANGLYPGMARTVSLEDPVVRDKVREALVKAEAWDFVSKLPEGMDTHISGGRNVHLSGGQKQRIAIARALVGEPQVLCLDEATSALDTSTEDRIKVMLQQEQERRGMTVIVIAHRLSTVQTANQIVVMKSGRAVERGTHEELLRLPNGVYHKLIMHNRAAAGLGADESETVTENASSWRGAPTQRRYQPRWQDEESVPYYRGGANSVQSDVAWRGGTALASASWDASERRNEATQLYALRQEEDEFHRPPRVETRLDVVSKKEARFRTFMKGQWFWLLPGVVLAIGLAVSFPIVAWLSGFALNALGYSDLTKLRNESDKWALWFLIIALINIALGFGASLFLETTSEHISETIKIRSLQAIMRQEIAFFDEKEHSSGALGAAIFNHAANMGTALGIVLCQLIITLGNLLASFIMSMVLSWMMAIVILPLILGMLLASWSNVYFTEKYEVGIQEPSDRTSAYIAEVMDSIGTVNSLGREAEVLKRFTKESQTSKRSTPFLACASVAYGFTQLFFFVITGLMMYWGITLAEEGRYTISSVFSTFEALFVAVFAAMRVTTFTPDIARARFGFHVVQRWLVRTPQVPIIDNAAPWPPSEPRDIVFHDVELRYPQRPDHAAIQDLNLTIHANTTVAFCGTSGSGKSSTLSLLQRFYEPAKGSITYGGLDLRSIPMHLWRSEMAFVSQEPVLYEGTLRWNLLLGAVDPSQVSDADLEDACRKACVWDFAMALPEGLDTMIGLKGSGLSGGQRQRISIARALLRKPRILLLDEATSALDPESEVLVQQALNNASASCTTVTIAHRLSTIRNADLIVVVEDGKIVEKGSHEELLRQQGRYYELVEAQL